MAGCPWVLAQERTNGAPASLQAKVQTVSGDFFAFLDGKNTSNGVCMYVWIAMDRESLHIYRANDSGVETDSKGPEFE